MLLKSFWNTKFGYEKTLPWVASKPSNTVQTIRLQELLLDFARLFDSGKKNDRAIAIVGPAFLDVLLTEMLMIFFIEDENEVNSLMKPEGHLGTFGAKVTACYCLGLIGEIIKSDL